MKTLDEVIAELEDEGLFADVFHYLRNYRENQHAYEEGNRKAEEARERYMEAVRNCERAENIYKQKQKAAEDALWIYKDDKDELTALRAYRKEQQANSPLTWQELRQMDGKPVYLEQYWYPTEDEAGVTEDEAEIDKYWAVIDNIQAKRIHFVGKNLNMGLAKSELDPNKHGGWQAYRKERE